MNTTVRTWQNLVVDVEDAALARDLRAAEQLRRNIELRAVRRRMRARGPLGGQSLPNR